ncbi:MAG: hypothetical protein MI700_08150 [Balneolales bacterium]|nr:hypothetical protein [Balneolales bacterium]
MVKSLKSVLPIILFSVFLQNCEQEAPNQENVQLLNQKLSALAEEADHELFTHHFNSIQRVIDAERKLSVEEVEILENMYSAFLTDTLANPSDIESYLNRERTMILAWTSPTDGKVSFSWLRLPKDWNPGKEYPLYVHLHGFWDVAEGPISYMSYTFNVDPSTTTAFEDGYWLSPWGRGNKWYQGISKTDVWEAIAEIESLVTIDQNRKYLSGHSMGGFGTWSIAQESTEIWAAIGIHSGALFHSNSEYLESEYAENLNDIPVYFVWGDKEESVLIESNETAISLLNESGHQNLFITTFDGGHDYNEVDVENMYNWMRTFSKQ